MKQMAAEEAQKKAEELHRVRQCENDPFIFLYYVAAIGTNGTRRKRGRRTKEITGTS